MHCRSLSWLLALCLFSSAMAGFRLADAATFTVTNTNDSGVGSLRQAVLDANADPAPDLIDFSLASGTHTITLTSGHLTVEEPVIIDGPDGAGNRVTITGDADGSGTFSAGDSRMFEIDGVDGNVLLRDLTLSGGYSLEAGGAIFADEGFSAVCHLRLENCRLENNRSDLEGGAIFADLSGGSLTLTQCVLDGNRVVSDEFLGGGGGAIAAPDGVAFNGTLTAVSLVDCVVSDNAAIGEQRQGGGLDCRLLTLLRCSITGNQAGSDGGGIHSEELEMTDCTVSGNAVIDDFGDGGGIHATHATMLRCSVTGNSVEDGSGGGIFATTLMATDSTISGNASRSIDPSPSSYSSNGVGGGIRLLSEATLNRCTISGNIAENYGGGMATSVGVTFENREPDGIVMIHCTVSGNRSAGDGGGIHHDDGPFSLSSCTVTQNIADSDNDGDGDGGGVFSGSVYFRFIEGLRALQAGNSIIAGNFDTFVSAGNDGPGDVHSDIHGVFETRGHNLIGTRAGQKAARSPAPFINGLQGDIVGSISSPLSPELGPLQNNGGSTETHLPGPGSLVVEAGDTDAIGDLPYSGPATLDQTGSPRLQGVDVDMGAVEFPRTYVVDSTADSGAGSLRQAIADSLAMPGGGFIVFDVEGAFATPGQTITLASPLLISDKLTIAAPPRKKITLDGGGLHRLFEVSGSGDGAVRLEHLTLRNGLAPAAGHGGAMLLEGPTLVSVVVVEAEGCTFDGNESPNQGGAVYGAHSGTSFLALGCTFSNNNAVADGGGIAGLGLAVDITNSTFSGNTSDGSGAAAHFSHCTGIVRHSTITNNTANGVGGFARTTANGDLEVNNCVLAGNTTTTGGQPDLSFHILSGGHNLVGVAVGLDPSFDPANNDQLGTSTSPLDPLLGPLSDNGGCTLTHGLLAGSPAIDTGSSAGVAVPPYSFQDFITDQRGQVRTFNGVPDVGAFEFPPEAAIRLFLDDPEGSEFRSDPAVVRVYRTRTEGALTVRLAVDPASTLSPGDFSLGGDAVVNGGIVEVTIADGEHSGFLRIVPVDDPTVEGTETIQFNLLADSAYALDPTTGNSATLSIFDSDFLVANGGNAGAGSLRRAVAGANEAGGGEVRFDSGSFAVPRTITLDSELEIESSVVIQGPASPAKLTLDGNGASRVFSIIGDGVQAELRNLEIRNGLAGFKTIGGGGIFISSSSGALIDNCAIVDCQSNASLNGGGGITCYGDLVLRNSTVSGNLSTGDGGGIHADLEGNRLLVVNSTISGNSAESDGGGIFVDRATGQSVILINSTITANIADSDNSGSGGGGGVASDFGNSAVRCGNSIIAGNFDTFVTSGNDGPNANDWDLEALFDSLGHNVIGSGDGQDFDYTGAASEFVDGVNGDQVGTDAAPIDPRLGPLANNGGPTETHVLQPGSPALDAGDNALITPDFFPGPPFTDQRGSERVAGGSVNIGSVEEGVILPVVTLVALDPDASEQNLDPGQFFVGRSQASPAPLLVNLSLDPASTATGGDGALGGTGVVQSGSMVTVTIPPNELSALVDLTPVDDSAIEGTETLGLLLQPGVGYDASSAFDQATVLIRDNEAFVTTLADSGAGSLRQGVDDLRAGGGGTLRFDPSVFTMPSTITLGSEIAIDQAMHIITPSGAVAPVLTAPNSRVFTISSSGGDVVELENLVIDGAAGTGHGGAIRITGSATQVTMTRCSVRNAVSTHRGGAVSVEDGSLLAVSSTFDSNRAVSGGGVYLDDGIVDLEHCTLSANTATQGQGGGISAREGQLVLTQVTVSGNRATGHGGGIFSAMTISSILFSTITGNICDSDNDGAGDGGGLFKGGVASFLAGHTIVAGNFDTFVTNGNDGASVHAIDAGAAGGSFLSDGHNLIGAGAPGFAQLVMDDIVGTPGSPVDPYLAPLADNGGPTRTHALLCGSPALDRGDNNHPSLPPSDQRGLDRIFGVLVGQPVVVDLGAYELQYEDYDDWAARVFPENTPAGLRQPSADFDDDGWTNGFERLHGSDPTDSSSQGGPNATLGDFDQLALEFPLAKTVDPATVGGQVSTDLMLWTIAPVLIEEVPENSPPGLPYRTVRMEVGSPGQVRTFGRIIYTP